MFDGLDDPLHRADIRNEAIRGVDRLCETFDPLLEDPAHTLFPHQRSELAALARIFDMSTSREPAEVWSDLRTMLVLQPSSERVEPDQTLTIMVVEDDPDLAEEVMKALGEAGHCLVGPFDSASAADVSAALHQVDLALIDINLTTETDGLDLARSLKQRWGTPTILMSGDIAALSSVGDLGDSVILKPFTSAVLRETVLTVAKEAFARRA